MRRLQFLPAPRVLPWRSWEEFAGAAALLERAAGAIVDGDGGAGSEEGSSATGGSSEDLFLTLTSTLRTWQKRGRLPVAVSTTLALLDVFAEEMVQQRQNSQAGRNGSSASSSFSSSPSSSSLYLSTAAQHGAALAISRFVNALADSVQTKQYAASVAELARRLSLARWVVDIRHDASHGPLPSLVSLRIAAAYVLDFARRQYWRPQTAAAVGSAAVSVAVVLHGVGMPASPAIDARGGRGKRRRAVEAGEGGDATMAAEPSSSSVSHTLGNGKAESFADIDILQLMEWTRVIPRAQTSNSSSSSSRTSSSSSSSSQFSSSSSQLADMVSRTLASDADAIALLSALHSARPDSTARRRALHPLIHRFLTTPDRDTALSAAACLAAMHCMWRATTVQAIAHTVAVIKSIPTSALLGPSTPLARAALLITLFTSQHWTVCANEARNIGNNAATSNSQQASATAAAGNSKNRRKQQSQQQQPITAEPATSTTTFPRRSKAVWRRLMQPVPTWRLFGLSAQSPSHPITVDADISLIDALLDIAQRAALVQQHPSASSSAQEAAASILLRIEECGLAALIPRPFPSLQGVQTPSSTVAAAAIAAAEEDEFGLDEIEAMLASPAAAGASKPKPPAAAGGVEAVAASAPGRRRNRPRWQL